MTYEKPGLNAFVPYGDDRAETARTLVDLADKHEISQNDIHAANDGFYITEELADLLYEDDDTTVGEVAGDVDPAAVDPIAADRARIIEAEEGAVFSQASAIATAQRGEERQQEADERVAASEVEAAEQAEHKAALAAYRDDDEIVEDDDDEADDGNEDSTEPVKDEEPVEDEEPAEEVKPYNEWEYPDLNHEVSERGLAVEDRKGETLIAALIADDEADAETEDADEVE